MRDGEEGGGGGGGGKETKNIARLINEGSFYVVNCNAFR